MSLIWLEELTPIDWLANWRLIKWTQLKKYPVFALKSALNIEFVFTVRKNHSETHQLDRKIVRTGEERGDRHGHQDPGIRTTRARSINGGQPGK